MRVETILKLYAGKIDRIEKTRNRNLLYSVPAYESAFQKKRVIFFQIRKRGNETVLYI